MALVLKRIYESYFWMVNDLADNRTDDWFLLHTPMQPLAIMIGYLYFVFKAGPALMKNRSPFDLTTTIIGFNLVQIVINLYLLIWAINVVIQLSPVCSPVDYSSSPLSKSTLSLTYWYYILKISDLLDTVFFVLRKKNRQISFLHVYHHTGMIFLSWVGAKFIPGGHSIFLGVINLSVHVVMYFYYLITAWDPHYKNSIWWKKYITQMQLLQFALLFVLFGGVLIQPNCKFPKVPTIALVSQNLFMALLFGDFYYRSYIKKNSKKSTTDESLQLSHNKTSQ